MTTSKTQQPHITLYRGEANFNKHAWSPFVIKLETRLRLGKVAYKADMGSMTEAPKGKVPYVRVQQQQLQSEEHVGTAKTAAKSKGELLPDSTLITGRLVREGLLEDLNSQLGRAERTHDLALRALLEDKLYFLKMHESWTYHFPTVREHILAPVPYPIRIVLGYYIYRQVQAGLHSQGTGRLTDAEIKASREEIWESVSVLLKVAHATKQRRDEKNRATDEDRNGPFWLLGETEDRSSPSEVDATLFAFVASTMVSKGNPQAQEEVKRHPILLDYARRIHTKYFPDYKSWE